MIVAGFGFRTSASAESLHDAYARAVSVQQASALATLSDKADSPAFQELAQRLGCPPYPVDEADIGNVQTLTNSAYARAARQTGSVAEAVALVAAGPGATLIAPRVISADRLATCALAQSSAERETT